MSEREQIIIIMKMTFLFYLLLAGSTNYVQSMPGVSIVIHNNGYDNRDAEINLNIVKYFI